MDKDTISKFVNILIMTAGVVTVNSKKTKEASVAVNISLQLRPSVLASLTSMLDTMLPKALEGEQRQEHLARSLSLFLSDAIDYDIIESAHQIAKGDSKWKH